MRFPKQFATSGALARTRISAGDSRLLLALISLAGEDNVTEPTTQTELADMAGLSRKSVRACLERLAFHDLVAYESKRGTTTQYTVMPAYQMAPSRAIRVPTYPQANGTPEGAKSGDQMAPLEVPTPKSEPTRVLNTPSGQHQNHPFAVNALRTLRTDRKLPLSPEELMRYAYRLGNGDPWDGYLRIKQATEANLTGAKNLAAVIRSRLDAA
ncbi:helix-turn-helix domain-containing protein [Microbacterium dauci]|uniref:Helix-turn-helix domain-containing protein n=1 Tax=Microbacterium dauci TaxID=3048008 RepID=A0ABT6ZI43_9MICO|nr:helix-turn-helix domain-containing protein [Microbacterium sp. LX3-4]MDJ1115395.1 helix-turn-helix domain-containing protein [Microbacterium sp. LX3-4]